MAKKDDNVFETTSSKTSTEAAAPVEDTVGAATDLVGTVIQRVLSGLGSLSAEKTKLVAKVIDLGETATTSAVKLARDANDAETSTERQVLGTIERLVAGWLRWGGQSAQAVASAATLRNAPAPRVESRAQA